MKLPLHRGSVTYLLWADLLTYPIDVPLTATAGAVRQALRSSEDILYNEDLQLALFCLYELHHSGINGVDDRWEWDPGLIGIRQQIESAFEARLRRGAADLFGAMEEVPRSPGDVAERLSGMASGAGGPSVSDFVGREASLEQLREFLVHRSVSQLRGPEPYAWAVPRLTGDARSALMEAQAGACRAGLPGRLRAERFAGTMAGLGLETGFGAYLDWVPALSLASANAVSLFTLSRRLRGAVAGHLAVSEIAVPAREAACTSGLRRWGLAPVVADPAGPSGPAHPPGPADGHPRPDVSREHPAALRLAWSVIEQDRSLADDVFFGAASACLLDRLVGRWQLEAWHADRSSLRKALPGTAAARADRTAPSRRPAMD